MKIALITTAVLLLFQSCGLTVDVSLNLPVNEESIPQAENTLTPEPTPTPEAWRDIRTTSAAGLNVRTGPGTEFPAIGVMLPGDVCQLDIGDDPDRLGVRGEWVRVHCVGFEGWAAGWLLELDIYG